MATTQTSRKKQRRVSAKRPTKKRESKPIPLRSEVDEPRPQPPADEGRQAAARREAVRSNALDDEAGKDHSLFDRPEDDEPR
jgi:hypothetical protein